MSSARPNGRRLSTPWLGNSTAGGCFREERRRSPTLESYSGGERPRNRYRSPASDRTPTTPPAFRASR
ncbi:hypothetical protein HPB50_011321 [Hyalomma asiaticum]|uniref:Uncharacterized protein n=1 Tax=Hyalomma asiaticum TaxID=266040 RepID=A0ACB7SPP4_HYAAI|nr:hypothetical protein HPB50_011321 [Hyalomma asiaticum]